MPDTGGGDAGQAVGRDAPWHPVREQACAGAKGTARAAGGPKRGAGAKGSRGEPRCVRWAQVARQIGLRARLCAA
jgi:hypothetical protein